MEDSLQSSVVQSLDTKGFMEGVTIKAKDGSPLCNYFGGIPYAEPPSGEFRWKKPRELAPCYGFGTRTSPGQFNTKAAVCPQLNREDTDENCLQLNMWIPFGEPPEGGWPIYFFIHGGFLQMGDANTGSPVSLLSLSTNRYILVKPTYRLSILGFLASTLLEGNYGLWDIRLALEWTYKNISYFLGNPGQITIGGYSAGAYASFLQLAYDIRQPPDKRLIKRIVMHSNGPGLPLRTPVEAEASSFTILCQALGISTASTPSEQLSHLRLIPSAVLLRAVSSISPIPQFRPVTDNDFIESSLHESIRDGSFAVTLRHRNISVWIGELSHEHRLYGKYLPPMRPANQESVIARLNLDYPLSNAQALVKAMPQTAKNTIDWSEKFGHLYANAQIYASQRGLIKSLAAAGVCFLRYRIEWRAKCAAKTFGSFDIEGAGHNSDRYLWFYGDGDELGLEPDEKIIVRKAFLNDFGKFIYGEQVSWGLKGAKSMRRLKPDGTTDIWKDESWEDGIRVWDKISEVHQHKAKI